METPEKMPHYGSCVLRTLETSPKLDEFAEAWTGNDTGIPLKVLATTLVPHELQLYTKVMDFVYHRLAVTVFLCTAMVAACTVVLVEDAERALGVGIFTFALLVAVSAWIGSAARKGFRDAGNKDKYMAILNGFAEAIGKAAMYLGIDEGTLARNGRKRAMQLTSDHLLSVATDVVRLEKERDDPAISDASYDEKQALVGMHLGDFREHYDLLTSLKLEKRRIPTIFAEARARLSEPQAA